MMGRRQFIQGLPLLAAAAGAGLPLRRLVAEEALKLKAAGYRFSRVEALFDGRVAIEGCGR